VSIEQVEDCLGERIETSELRTSIQADVKYEGFVERQKEEIERMRENEGLLMPENLDYREISGLLTESRTKLEAIRPRSLGQAARIPGVTPADITVLMIHLARRMKNKVSRETVDL
jgi:tRNA uridine 5-carboxymethylaminomethyl modification enzyme